SKNIQNDLFIFYNQRLSKMIVINANQTVIISSIEKPQTLFEVKRSVNRYYQMLILHESKLRKVRLVYNPFLARIFTKHVYPYLRNPLVVLIGNRCYGDFLNRPLKFYLFSF